MRRYTFVGSMFAGALIEACWKEKYSRSRLVRDAVAGITVGIIAIPLAMALAIASGVPPQYGLYTSAVAGIVIALSGGSRYSVSGPTAAFVVILYPVSQQFGLPGLLVATIMAGIFMVVMGLAKLSRLIEYIPLPVTLGFTSGIAITLATMQIKDFLGLTLPHIPESYTGKVAALVAALPGINWGDAAVGAVTLFILLFWHKTRIHFPPHLPALLGGTLCMWLLSGLDPSIATIGSRFHYLLADGSTANGIPAILPSLMLPWQLPTATGAVPGLSWEMLRALSPAAFSMAMLGAIESLLCAVVLDGMTGSKHHSNNELIGQGLGNIVAPFFGGITATAAIARSAANVRAGATSPISPVIHSLLVIVALLCLAPLLSWLPMAAMAALLLLVAWNMSEVHKVIDLARRAPLDDIIVMLLCMSLTVLMDMVIAITVGIVLASLMFMRNVARLTHLQDVSDAAHPGVHIINITGPLFFAAAEKIFQQLKTEYSQPGIIILQWDAVSLLDAGGLNAFQRYIAALPPGQEVMITRVGFQPLKTLVRAQVKPIEGKLRFFPSREEALQSIEK